MKGFPLQEQGPGMNELFNDLKNEEEARKAGWKDPECPKCGLKLANKLMYVCQHSFCPSGLN